MYKRRARLTFLSSTPDLAARAARIAAALGASWIEARACLVGTTVTDCDLLVTLDAAALAVCQAPPPGCRHVHWPLSPSCKDRDIATYVESLVGGMRLLARLDASGAPNA